MAAAIRVGAICKSCTAKKCVDIGTEAEPLSIECPSCSGNGCSDCEEKGVFVIDGCPNTYCGPVARLCRLADLFDKGILPVAGGALDQAAWFLEAVGVLASDEHQMRAER